MVTTGEYWICDGQAIYADGDFGDINHEGLVIQHVFSELVDELENDDLFSPLAASWRRLSEDEGVDTIAAVEELNNFADSLLKENKICQDDLDDIEEFIRQKIEWTDEKMRVALGRTEDARVYGIENLGWIRVLNNNIQLADLTKKSLDILADGLYDCFGELWEKSEYFIEEHKRLNSVSNDIRLYRNVPGSVIASGDLGYLRTYADF